MPTYLNSGNIYPSTGSGPYVASSAPLDTVLLQQHGVICPTCGKCPTCNNSLSGPIVAKVSELDEHYMRSAAIATQITMWYIDS